MAKYNPRLTAPSSTDKNYLHYSKGGYNYCIHIANGSCLPNCVGYAWGRWRELLGKKPKLSTANAENWWGNTSDGYQRGQTPKIGAVMCWRKGKAGIGSDGAGHVGIVEKINSDGSVTYSNSAYGGTRFYVNTLKAPYKIGSKYTFQGFIYLPISFDEDETKTTDKTTNSVTTQKIATKSAKSYSKSLAGTYNTTANLNVRDGAGTTHKSMVVIPKGTAVKNYGYYTSHLGTKWLYIQFTYKNVTYTGFASSKYLKK